MDSYQFLKLIHLLSATVLFGTGLGTAFSMWMADRKGDTAVIAGVARNVVLADWIFTTPAVIIQPLSGALLINQVGYDWSEPWIVTAIVLYLIAGCCWLPVVRLQIRMRDHAAAALAANAPLPDAYHRTMRLWFILGWPAFAAIIAIFWLMIARPVLW